MHVLIFTDAYHPQVNGVVRTLTTTIEHLKKQGHYFSVFSPKDCILLPKVISNNIDTTIDFVIPPFWKIFKKARYHDGPIHISTEGPIGLAALLSCVILGRKFTTTYHTKFPEYVKERFNIPLCIGYWYERYFHNRAVRTMVATKSLKNELFSKGFRHLVMWERGVDTVLFHPSRRCESLYENKPVALFFGRVAKEKNIKAFLDAKWEGVKYVIGDGPYLGELKVKYGSEIFLGKKTGEELAKYVASADITVFPSLTDTYGLTIIESLACGTPVAAFDVIGPTDILKNNITGCLVPIGGNLGQAMSGALLLKRDNCRSFAETKTWDACTKQFINNLEDSCITEPFSFLTYIWG